MREISRDLESPGNRMESSSSFSNDVPISSSPSRTSHPPSTLFPEHHASDLLEERKEASNEGQRKDLREPLPPISIRLMQEQDIAQVLDIWKENELHEGTHTIQSFLRVDPEGFAVAVRDDTDEVIGMCAGVFIDPDSAFVGLYGVKPQFQGRGIGIKIWKTIMCHVGSKNAGLYAVPEHLHTYRDRAGFSREDSIRMVLYDCDSIKSTDDLVKSMQNVTIEEITPSNEQSVFQFDSLVVKCDRSKLLTHTFREEDTINLVARDKYASSGEPDVVGYICIRTNNIGKGMVGPLYADNDAIAEFLMHQALEQFNTAVQHGLLFMTLDCSAGGIRMAQKLKLTYGEDFPRFFTKFLPVADADRIYCIHSPNFSLF